MTITVRPGKSLSVVATLDGTHVDRGPVDSSAIILDAERSAHLLIADLVEVEVQAGAPEKRKAAAALRKRWEIEGTACAASCGRVRPGRARAQGLGRRKNREGQRRATSRVGVEPVRTGERACRTQRAGAGGKGRAGGRA